MVQWIDTHCHLDAPEFAHDVADVVSRAHAAGVRGLVLPAVRVQDAAGNPGSARSQAFVVDTQAPAAPTLAESGASRLADGFLNQAESTQSLTVRVTLPTSGSRAEAGDHVELLLGGQAVLRHADYILIEVSLVEYNQGGARAEEVFQDVIDGIRRNVSVGYLIHEAQLVNTKDGLETYRVTDWEPFEVSIVSVPADPTVGVGRSAGPPPGMAASCVSTVRSSAVNSP